MDKIRSRRRKKKKKEETVTDLDFFEFVILRMLVSISCILDVNSIWTQI